MNLTRLFAGGVTPHDKGSDAVAAWPEWLRSPPSFKAYQRRCMSFMHQGLTSYGLRSHRGSGCYLAASPGLGKTRMGVAGLLSAGISGQDPVIVVGPLAASESWCATDADPQQVFGITVDPLATGRGHTWVYLHVEVLAKHWEDLADVLQPTAIIFDEAHLLSNPGADRTQAAYHLSRFPSVQKRLMLSATPAPKTRMDLASQLRIMQPEQWESPVDFGMRYYGGRYEQNRGNIGYYVFEEPTNTEELRARLDLFTLRFGRWDVAELGAGRIQRRAIEVDVRGEYADRYWEKILEARSDWKAARALARESDIWVSLFGKRVRMTKGGMIAGKDSKSRQPKNTGPNHLIALTRAIGALALAKVAPSIDIIVERLGVHRMVVAFTEIKEAAARITEGLRARGVATWGPLTGDELPHKRWPVCQEFAAAGRGALVATRASTGISNHCLSEVTCAVITAPWWNPDGNIQTEGRILPKPGDPKDGDREVIYVLAKGSAVDQRILELVEMKEQESRAIMGESEASDLAASLLFGEGQQEQSFKEIWEAMQQEQRS